MRCKMKGMLRALKTSTMVHLAFSVDDLREGELDITAAHITESSDKHTTQMRCKMKGKLRALKTSTMVHLALWS